MFTEDKLVLVEVLTEVCMCNACVNSRGYSPTSPPPRNDDDSDVEEVVEESMEENSKE